MLRRWPGNLLLNGCGSNAQAMNDVGNIAAAPVLI